MTTTTPIVATSPLWSAQAHIPSIAGRQLVITRGEGNYVYTSDGRRLFDGTAGLWHTNVGHCRPELVEVATRQLETLETYHTFGRFANDKAIELSEVLAHLSPIPESKVILNNGGSDSIDVACKLARRHWQLHGRPDKKIILSREFAYHGLHAYGTSVAGLDFNRDGYGTESLVPETARFSTRDIAAVAARISEIGADRIAAIIAEPVQGTGGVIPPEPGYLSALQQLATDNEILFIADEVITGFGRTGTMFATTRYNLTPDMITFAKGVTSGYAPLGGVLIGRRLWEPYFRDSSTTPIFRHGSTYGGHAMCSAVALRNIELLDELHLLPHVTELEGTLRRALGTLADHVSDVTDVRVAGLLGGVELADSIDANLVVDHLIDHGFITRALRGNTVQISPPFTTTESEIVDLTTALAHAIAESADLVDA